MQILVINNIVPDENRSGADLRLANIIYQLSDDGHAMTLVTLRECKDQLLIQHYAARGILLFHGVLHELGLYVTSDHRGRMFETILKSSHYDLAFITLWFWHFLSMPEYTLACLWRFSPLTKILIITDDRHGVRQSQIAALTGSIIDYECANERAQRETEIYQNSDCVIAIAEPELQTVKAASPKKPSVILPLSIGVRVATVDLYGRSGLCFLGNFSNAANRDGLACFLRDIFPKIRLALPSVTLTVAGSHSVEYISHVPDGVSVLGHVSDLNAFFGKHRVFVSPIQYGTGICTKNLMSMAHGVPVVTTTIGKQSITALSEAQSYDSPDDFANKVISLCTDDALWWSVSNQGLRDAKLSYSRDRSVGLKDIYQLSMSANVIRRPESPNWSVRLFETSPHVKTTKRRNTREVITAYMEVGHYLLEKKAAIGAINQYRHAISLARLSLMRGSDMAKLCHPIIVGLMACYDMLEDQERRQACEIAIATLAL